MSTNWFYNKAAKLGQKKFRKARGIKAHYSDCPKCHYNDTYKFANKPDGSQWICNNCNNIFIILKK